jgi:polysaccharide export outer membrane protein
MSLRGVAAVALIALTAAGCSKSAGVRLSASDALPPPPAAGVAVAVPAEEGPLSGDPVADLAPLPLATSASSDWMNATTVIEAAPEDETGYLLDAGDRVRVFVYGQPSLSRTYPIDGQGFINMPLIGSVRARTLTTYDLAGEIAAQLRVSYVRDPEVTVEVAAYRPFYILGEVRLPGQYPYVSGMTIQAAVAIAGGYTPRANEREIQVTRLLNGEQEEIEAPPNYRIRPGDSVYVRERWF